MGLADEVEGVDTLGYQGFHQARAKHRGGTEASISFIETRLQVRVTIASRNAEVECDRYVVQVHQHQVKTSAGGRSLEQQPIKRLLSRHGRYRGAMGVLPAAFL